jgi:hypothetical protein
MPPQCSDRLEEAPLVRLSPVTATAEPSLYDIPFRDAEGRERTLGEFRGDVLLIVNTASY